jgi:hypothetical protein
MDQQSSSPLSSSMSTSSSLLPPSGFSPPMNLHHRKPSKTSTVITANANNRSLSSTSESASISASTSADLSSPRLTRSSTKKTRQQNGDIGILGGRGSSSSGTSSGTSSGANTGSVSPKRFYYFIYVPSVCKTLVKLCTTLVQKTLYNPCAITCNVCYFQYLLFVSCHVMVCFLQFYVEYTARPWIFF